MVGSESKRLLGLEKKTGGRLSAKRILIPVIFSLVFLACLIIIVTMLSSNAQAAYGLQISVQSPKDKYLDPATIPQSTLFSIDIQNTGTSEESVNVSVTFNDPAKETAGWTVNPSIFTVNQLGSGVTETRQVTVTAPDGEPYPSFAQLTVDGFVQESPSTQSSDSFIARVSAIYDVRIEVRNNENSKSVDQGDSVTYYLNVSNFGNTQDTIDLSASGYPADWIPILTPSSVTVDRNSTVTTPTVTFSLPSQVESKAYPVVVSATSQGDPSESDSTSTFTTVNPEYLLSVSVTPSPTQEGLPDTSVEYTLTVDNLGNKLDRVGSTITNLEGLTWSTFADKGEQNIPYQSSVSWTLTVMIPDNAKDWERGKVQFTATSTNNATATDSITTITEVGKVYSINIYIADKTNNTDPGIKVYYFVQVTNTGNTNDTIDLSTSGEFASSISPTQLTDLSPNVPTIVNMEVDVPSDALAGFHYNTITAQSENGITTENDTVSTDVNPVYDVVVLPSGASSKDGDPGGPTVNYQIRVRNEGTDEDTISLTLEGEKPGWAGLDLYQVLVPAKSFVLINLTITIPSGEPINTWNVIVNGTSFEDPDEWDIATFEIRVQQTYEVSVSSGDNSNQVPAGSLTMYYISVKNTGSGYDDFIATSFAENPIATTWASISPSNFGLSAGQNITVTITIDVPTGTNPGIYNIWFNVTSDNESVAFDALITLTEVTQSYEVLIAGGVEQSGEAPPETVISYSISVYNTGTGIDSFVVEKQAKPISNHPSWADLSADFIQNLAPDDVFVLYVNITIPEDTGGDILDYLKIIIRSNGDPAPTPADAYVWINTTITPVRSAILTPQQDTFYREPGDSITVTLQLTNDGTATDTLTVEDVTPVPYDTWGVVVLPATVTLDAGNSTNMVFQIIIDPDVTRDESPIKLNLVVRSAGADDDIVETRNLTIHINQTYGVKISTTQNEKTRDPGQFVEFEIKIKNEGNDEDTFTLSHSGADQDSTGIWEFSEVTLQPNEIITVIFNVSIDSDHNTTDIIIKLNATSDGDVSGLTFGTLQITVHVNPRYEVKLGQNGGDRKDGLSGQTTQFNLTVKNDGTDTDTFEIEVEVPSGFQVTLSDVAIQVESVENDPLNSTQIVVVYVFTTEGTPTGEYLINITATSVNDATAIDTFTYYIDVEPTRDVSLYSPIAAVAVDAGQDATFAGIQVTNEGNDVDSFSFYIIGLPPGWTTSPLSTINNVPPDSTANFDLIVYTTAESASGIYPFAMFARSVEDPSVETNVTLTVQVEQVYGIQLPSSVSGKSVDIGNSVTYILQVKNSGNGPDLVELTLTGDVDTWTWLNYNATENGTTIHVSPPAGGSITVTLHISPATDYWDTGDGSLTLTIEAESLTDTAINPATDTVTATTTINPVYGANIIPISPVTSGEPGELKSFLFNVENTGTTTDSYNIRVDDISGPAGSDTSLWFPIITFSPTSISNLGSGLTQQVTMFVDIPEPSNLYLIPPGSYLITVEVTSGGDSDQKDTEVFTLNVQQVYIADIQNSVTPKDVNVGSSVEFSITISNEGNDLDTFSVELEGDPDNPVSWGRLSHAGSGQSNLSSLQGIDLDASGPSSSTVITLTIWIPDRNDPDYPTIDPDDITLTVIVKPSEESGTDDQVVVTADINPIYEFDFVFVANKQNVDPGNSAVFQIHIFNKGTVQDRFTYEISQWTDDDWSQYGPTFSPTNIDIAADSDDFVTLTINTPSDLKKAISKEYSITVKVQSRDGSDDWTDYCFVTIDPVYDVDITATGPTSSAVDVGEKVTYQLTVRNIGNSNETFALTKADLDTSAQGGGDQSSWVTIYLLSDPTTPITSIDLEPDESKTILVEISVPPQGEELTAPLQIEIKATSESDPTASDSQITDTTLNPIYSFTLQTDATDNTLKGKPGDILSFKITVRNTGTISDDYDFSVSSYNSDIFTITSINPNPVPSVGVQNKADTTVTVTISSDNEKALVALSAYEIVVTGESTGDRAVSQDITLKVNITSAAAVEVDPADQTDSGEPGDIIDYSIQIKNKGNDRDTYALTLSGDNKDWGEIMDASGTNVIKEVTLEAAGKSNSFVGVIVRVTIPGTGKTNADQTYDIFLKAASALEDDVEAIATVSTTVERFVDLELEYSGSGEPTADYNPNKSPPKFTFKVTNDGNVPEDGINVNVEGMPNDWDFSPPPIESLEPGKSTTFSVTFDIPDDEDDNTVLQIYVTSSPPESEESERVFVRINITKPNVYISEVTGLDDMDTLKSKAGNSMSIGVTIGNDGDAKAENIQVKFYEDANIRGTKSITSINPGETKTITFRWTVVADDVALRIEASKAIETDESDNEMDLDVFDLRPDLDFTGEKLNISAAPRKGETITLTAFVKNDGGNAEGVLVKFYNGNKIIDTDEIDIDFGETGEATVNWEVPDKEGETIEIRAEIDLPDAIGDGKKTSKNVKIEAPTDGIGSVFEGAGLIGMGIGIGIGIILFIIGLAIGRGSAGRRRGPEGAGGPSFAAFEKEEGMGKGAAKGPAAGPAPFGAPPGGEEGAPPEDEEAAAPKEAVRVRCPKCGKVKEVTSTQRPLQIPCECGTTLMLKK